MHARPRLGLLLALALCSACGTSVTDAPATTAPPAPPPGGGTPPPPGFQTSVPPIDLNVVVARPTAANVTLGVYAATARTATVTLDNGRTVSAPLAAGRVTNIELPGLAADRAYAYRVTAGTSTLQGRFHTARSAGASWRFAMQADSHLDNNTSPAVYANTLANVIVDSTDLFIDLGDTFMSDKFGDFRDAAPMYYAQRHYFGLVGATTPVYLVPGNHDAESAFLPANAQWAAMMRATYFTAPQQDGFYSTSAVPRNYVAWRWGDATFIALDPFGFTPSKPNGANAGWTWTLGREQYDWLAATLQRTTSRYTFVFLHHLVGGNGAEARGGAEASVHYEWGGQNADGSTGFATQRPGWSRPIHDLLLQYKVSAVFHGHDHLYVHQMRDGIHYQEVPQPGFPRENATSSAADYGYRSGTLLASSGHLRVTVTPAKATVEYVRSRLGPGNGEVVDRYDIAPVIRP